MSNPLIQKAAQQAPDFNQLFADFKKSPAEFLLKSRFQLPDNVGNNPQGIIQHLLNTGQISQAQISQARQMLPRFSQFFTK